MKVTFTFLTLTLAAILSGDMNAQNKPVGSQTDRQQARGLFVSKLSDAIQVAVLKSEGGGLIPIDPSREFKHGDQIRVSFQCNFDGYVYIVNVSPEGKRCLLFPDAQGSNNVVAHDALYFIPTTGVIVFGKEKGIEVLQVIASRQRIPYLDDAVKNSDGCLADSSPGTPIGASLAGGITRVRNKPQYTSAPDIKLSTGKDKDSEGTIVFIPSDKGGRGKLKPGEAIIFEIRLIHI